MLGPAAGRARERGRETETETQRAREGGRERERETERKRVREREKKREKERERDRQREREREREKVLAVVRWGLLFLDPRDCRSLGRTLFARLELSGVTGSDFYHTSIISFLNRRLL